MVCQDIILISQSGLKYPMGLFKYTKKKFRTSKGMRVIGINTEIPKEILTNVKFDDILATELFMKYPSRNRIEFTTSYVLRPKRR